MLLPPDLVMPDFGGGCLADVPATALRALGAPTDQPGLAQAALPATALRDVQRVVLLVLDGFGWNQLQRAKSAGAVPHLATMKGAPITSIAPSTTVAALTTLATGVSPLAHGILGYRMHLPRFGLTANMIRMRGVLGSNLEAAGLVPETFVPAPTVFERLKEAGVRADAVTRASFLDGALTRIVYRGVAPHGFVNGPDLFVAGRRVLAEQQGARGFLRLYYDGLDGVAHEFGPHGPEHEAEAAAIDAALGRELLRHADDPQALLLVTADHGHIQVPFERAIPFTDHPELLDSLVLPPTGEGRFAYLHVREGRSDAVRKYVESTWPQDAAILSVREAVGGGLFGPGPEHPEFARRAGDLLLLARNDVRFVTEYGRRHTGHLGNHGGLSEAEMRVPLLWQRLG